MIILKNGDFSLSLRPLGAKIISLRFKKRELVYLPKNKEFYKIKPQRGNTFDEKMAWGGDICAPSVARCEVNLPSRSDSFGPDNIYTMNIGDHGDFWTTKFKIKNQTNKDVTLVGESKEFRLEVTFKLQGSTLFRSFVATNLTRYTLPFTFADHLLLPISVSHKTMQLHENVTDYIHLPNVNKMQVEWSFADKLGKKGNIVNWPTKRTRPFADKLFAKLKKDKKGEYSVSYKKFYSSNEARSSRPLVSNNKPLLLTLSSRELNYIGYWHTEDGWHNQCNLGLELSNTNDDSLKEAVETDKVWWIKSGQSKEWSILLSLRGA